MNDVDDERMIGDCKNIVVVNIVHYSINNLINIIKRVVNGHYFFNITDYQIVVNPVV